MKTLVAGAILLPALVLAQVPQKLGYQGRLLKADGTPEIGSVAITFAIYDAETVGTLQWSEVQPVELTNGFYSVFVGDQTPFPTDRNIFDGRPLWLEVTVGSSAPLTPRQRIASVAYALTATNLTGGTVNATSLSVSGPVSTSGTVSAGSIAASSLSVSGSVHANGGVTGLPSPSGSSDAATMGYVDGKFPITSTQISGSAGITGSQLANQTITATQLASQSVSDAKLSGMYFLRVASNGALAARKGDYGSASVSVSPYGVDTSHYRITDSRLTTGSIGVATVSWTDGANLDNVPTGFFIICIPGSGWMDIYIRSNTGYGNYPNSFNVFIAI